MQNKSTMKQDSEVVVERNFHIEPVSARVLDEAMATLLDVPGMQMVVPLVGRRPGLRLRYDTRKLDASRIGGLLGELGLQPAGGLWERWRMGWLNMLDDNIRDNASRPPAACCSRPPPGAGKGIKGGRHH